MMQNNDDSGLHNNVYTMDLLDVFWQPHWLGNIRDGLFLQPVGGLPMFVTSRYGLNWDPRFVKRSLVLCPLTDNLLIQGPSFTVPFG